MRGCALDSNEKTFHIKLGGGTGSGGTRDYNMLQNKPQINGVELIGNKISSELGLMDFMIPISNHEIDKIIFAEGVI